MTPKKHKLFASPAVRAKINHEIACKCNVLKWKNIQSVWKKSIINGPNVAIMM